MRGNTGCSETVETKPGLWVLKKKLKKAASRIRAEECVGASQSSQSKAKEREENFQAYVK